MQHWKVFDESKEGLRKQWQNQFWRNTSPIVEIFRIETDIFNYESSVCKAFDEFIIFFQIISDVLTKYILGFKTYEDYKDDSIYEWSDKVPCVNEKPWKLDGVWKEPTAVKHRCKLFCFKSGHYKWTTCNWRDEEYCNGGNLPGKFQVGNIIHYQDYEWYEALEDSDLKDEVLRNKVALEESINQDEELSDDAWSNYSSIEEWCDQEKDVQDENEDVRDLDDYLVRGEAQFNKDDKTRCKLLGIPYAKPPACKTERFKIVKY
nr:hypothetical protein [Tanacetum cinerariifolium]